MELCQHQGCTALPTVEAHYPVDSGAQASEFVEQVEVRLLCTEHAQAEGYCTFCGEYRSDRDAVTGLCADCCAEGIHDCG